MLQVLNKNKTQNTININVTKVKTQIKCPKIQYNIYIYI